MLSDAAPVEVVQRDFEPLPVGHGFSALQRAVAEVIQRDYYEPLRQWVKRLVSIKYPLLGPDEVDELVDEVLSETMLKVMPVAGLFAAGRLGMAWLITVARNKLFEYRRRTRREQRRFRNLQVDAWNSQRDSRGDEFELVDASIDSGKLQRLRNAFERLDPKNRRVLELRYYNGLKDKELAMVLKLKSPAVRKLVQRAKEDLLKQFMSLGL